MGTKSCPGVNGRWVSKPYWAVALCVATMLGLPAYSAEPARDTPHAVYQPRAQMHLLVSYWKTKSAAVSDGGNFSLMSHIVVPDQSAPAGGTATFGWFDSGKVMLLQYVEYLPSITFAQSNRTVRPTKLPVDIEDVPRYIMACAWPLEKDAPPGTPIKAYAEREDASTRSEEKRNHVTFNVVWRNVRVDRAESKFADKDYCTEIAQSKTSSVAWWWPAPAKK